MIKVLKNLSIGKKFIFSLILFVVIPLLTVLLLIYTTTINRNRENERLLRLEVLKQTRSGLESFIHDMDFVSMSIIADSEMQSFLKNYEGEKPEQLQHRIVKLNYTIENLLYTRTYIKKLSMFREDDILYRFGSLSDQEDFSLIPSISDRRGRTYWSASNKISSFIHPYYEAYGVTQYRVVNDLYDLNNPLGYQSITVNEEYIRSLYDWIDREADSELFIMNSYGRIVSATNGALLGSELQDQTARDKLLEAKEGYFVDTQGRLITFYSLAKPEWIVVRRDQYDYISENDRIIINIIFLCLGLIILFGAFFGLIQNKTIIKPITLLSKQAESFKEGHYHAALYSDSNDEIGTLNRSINEMTKRVEDLIEEQYKNRLRAKEAELKAMQSHINPHFLYNSLDSIRWMCLVEQKPEIAKQVEALSKIFRHTLNMGKSMTTIEEELDHLKNYIHIQKNRYGDKLQISVQAEEKLLSHPTLKLILQPLVENAIVHGLEKKIGGGTVRVKVYSEKSMIYFEVTDDGLGTDQSKINQLLKDEDECHNVFALKNIDERLKHQYGEDFGIRFNSVQGKGTTVVVNIPLKE